MSVEPRLYFPTAGEGAQDWRTQERCFYCYRPLSAPFVHWLGSTGSIALHPPCVIELTIRLYRDVWEIECSPGYGYVTERSLTALRERLVREEGRG